MTAKLYTQQISYCLIIFTFIFSIFVNDGNSQNKTDFPVLKGPYLGQKLPGNIPEVFAPSIVSVEGRYEFALLKPVYGNYLTIENVNIPAIGHCYPASDESFLLHDIR